jgi:EmrB/QacA subfamily drug resistance transporter
MLVGFFMILVDATIVAVANPTIMEQLHTDYATIIWVTSAYLLAYAVPLLVAGRLGDRFGPKNLYLLGLTVFTAASLWCGLAGSVETLITARVMQGLGAALLTPQTLSTITRIFPADRRGVAMSLWGATAGVATLVGPLAGGVLVDWLGWQWIFFVNVPVGLIGLVLAARFIPALPTFGHDLDLVGVMLSGLGMFLVVYSLQEGQINDWGWSVWLTIGCGTVVLATFAYWQSVNGDEPLVPLGIFRDRNFTLANLGVAVVAFVVTALLLPLMFYAQAVCGLSPTRSALLIAPMAIISGSLAPFVGRIVDRVPPRSVIGFGFLTLTVALTWLSFEMTPVSPIWRLVLPISALGVGMAFLWAPLAATATRRLPPEDAGAGSGVYNSTRQVGSVLGSAAMAAFMTTCLNARMPAVAAPGESSVTRLPRFLHQPFAAAMSQSLLLPAFVALVGVVAALFLVGRVGRAAPRGDRRRTSQRDSGEDDFDDDDVFRLLLVGADTAQADFDESPRTNFDWQPHGREAAGFDGPPHEKFDLHPHPGAADGFDWLPQRGTTVEAEAEHWEESWLGFLEEPPPGPAAEPFGYAHYDVPIEPQHKVGPLHRHRAHSEPQHSGSRGEPVADRRARHRKLAEGRRPSGPASFGRHRRVEPDENGRHAKRGD